MNLNEVLTQLPMDQIAGRLGVDRATAENAVQAALPALLGGMQANAHDAGGANSLAGALGQHQDDLLAAVNTGQAGLDQIDVNDGGKIVRNVFGDQRDQVINQLGGATGAGSALISRLLPILAPLVMSYLARRVLGGGAGAGPDAGADLGRAGGIDLGSILGDMLGGATSGSSSSSGLPSAGGVDLGDLLGGLLGGGRR